MSPVWPITASAATSGGATQAVTTSEESAPMTAVPTSVPASAGCSGRATRAWNAGGTCRLNTPNIAERQQHEQPGEHDDDPRLLEERLRLLAGGREGGARDRVGERHAEHVGERQRECAAARDGSVAALRRR